MLILTRRPGESVILDNPIAGAEPITVTVLGVKGNQIRLYMPFLRRLPRLRGLRPWHCIGLGWGHLYRYPVGVYCTNVFKSVE